MRLLPRRFTARPRPVRSMPPLLLACLVFGIWLTPAGQSAPATGPSTSRAGSAGTITAIGAIESHSAEVRPQIDAAVREVNCHEGQAVKRGDVLIQLDDAVARAQADAAKAEFQVAEDRAKAIENAPKGSFVQSDKDLIMMQRQVAAAKLVEKENAVAQARILAPTDGIVTRCTATPGEFVARGTSLARIVPLQPLWARFAVTPEDYARLRPGQPVSVYGPRLRDQLASARITFISPEFDPATGTAVVKAELDNPAGTLRPGMTVTVKAEGFDKENQ